MSGSGTFERASMNSLALNTEIYRRLRGQPRRALGVLPFGLMLASLVPVVIFSMWLSTALGIPDGAPVRDQPNGLLWLILLLSSFVIFMLAGYFLGWVLNGIILLLVFRWPSGKVIRALLYSEVPQSWLSAAGNGLLTNEDEKFGLELSGDELADITDLRVSNVAYAIFMFSAAASVMIFWAYVKTSPFISASAAAFCFALGVRYISKLYKPRTHSKRIGFGRDGVLIWYFRSERIGSIWNLHSAKVDWADVSGLDALDLGDGAACFRMQLKQACDAGRAFTSSMGITDAQKIVSDAQALRPLQ